LELAEEVIHLALEGLVVDWLHPSQHAQLGQVVVIVAIRLVEEVQEEVLFLVEVEVIFAVKLQPEALLQRLHVRLVENPKSKISVVRVSNVEV